MPTRSFLLLCLVLVPSVCLGKPSHKHTQHIAHVATVAHAATKQTPSSNVGTTPTVAASAIPTEKTATQTKPVSFPPAWPSFLISGEVLCLDELDFNAFSHTGRFHTRGSQESCTRMTDLTRVVVLNQAGRKSQIRVADGPMEAHVGWTNGQLPFAGQKPSGG